MVLMTSLAWPAAASTAPPPAAAGGVHEQWRPTPEQQQELEAMAAQLRATALAEARRLLADPEFRAAVAELKRLEAAGVTDQNEEAVPLQLAASILYQYGSGQLKKALLGHFGYVTSLFNPIPRRMTAAQADDYNPALLMARGLSAIAISAAMAYLSPPVVVDLGWRDQSWSQRLAAVTAIGWQLPGPPLIELDVDNVSDPASCSATLAIDATVGGAISDYGEFVERDLAWAHPYGSFPGLGEEIDELLDAITPVLPSFPGLNVPDIIGEIADAGEFGVAGPVADFIDDLLESALDVEDYFYDSFSGWRFDVDRIDCSSGPCLAPDALSHALFHGQVSAVPGILNYDFKYRQAVEVTEYFPPVFTGLQEHLTVVFEALEPGGAPTDLPPVDHIGSPAPGHTQLLNRSWFGLEDNCDPNPRLEWNLPPFLELGIHELPVRATDRSGNVTETTITVVVQDSLPPDLLPPEDVGVTAPDSSPLPFTAPGVGCVTWLCEGNPPQFALYPPTSFDFASLEPVIDCTVTNSLYATPQPCATADLAVGEDNHVEWTLTDPSGNSSTTTQLAVVRAAGTNRDPSVQGGAFTIASGVATELPLAATDPDVDPLSFVIDDLPDHGDLDVAVQAIYQTRFATSGTIQRATSFVKLEAVPGNGPTDLLIVADSPGRRLLVFDITLSDSRYLYDLIDLGDINPDAIQYGRYPRSASGSSLSTVLRNLWIGDFTADGPGDTSVNTLWFDAETPTLVGDFAVPAPGLQGRDFRIESIDAAGGDQHAEFTVFFTADPPLLDVTPSYNPANQHARWRADSTDTGATWSLSPLPPGPVALNNVTSAVSSASGGLGCVDAHAFWSTDPPWGEVFGPHPLTDHLEDPDGPGPALPVLQDPTSFGLDYCGTSGGGFLVLDSQENKLEAFDYQYGAGTPAIRRENSHYPLRLTSFVTIRGIEEIADLGGAPRFVVLDDEGLYRFDLAGRMEAFVSFLTTGNNSLAPDGLRWADVAVNEAGDTYLLDSGDNDHNGAAISRLSLGDGVGNATSIGVAAVLGSSSDLGWALAADNNDVFAAAETGLFRCNTGLDSCTTLLDSAPYRDIEIRDGTSEVFLSEISSGVEQVVRADRNGAVIAVFGAGIVDFVAADPGADLSDVVYGRMAYDEISDRLYVSDCAQWSAVDQSQCDIPRIQIFSGDGAHLESVTPDADPYSFFSWLQVGDFGSVSDIAVGPDRFYVAEIDPLKRLHVFEAVSAVPVTCPDPDDECRTVTYTSDPGYTGPDAFGYTASDPFDGTSPQGIIALDVIDDQTPPSIVCGADVVIEARDDGGVTVVDPIEREPHEGIRNLFSPTAADNTDLPEPTISHDGGQTFGVGSNLITFTATDGAGNTATCQATLTVTDTTPPEFDTSGEGLGADGPVRLPEVEVEASGPMTPFSPPLPTVYDIAGIASLSHNGPSEYPLGDTEIVWTAVDLGGNATTALQTVRVVDTTPPSFVTPLPPDDRYSQTAVNGWANPIQYDVQQAVDLVELVDLDCRPEIGDPVPTGVVSVECQAQDGAGNLARRTFLVEIVDPDTDGDDLSDLVDLAPASSSDDFSDAAHGGVTAGVRLGGDHRLLITDGPTTATGVRAIVGGRSGPLPAQVSLCAGRLTVALEFTTYEIEPGAFEEANDAAVLSCLPGGAEVWSERGSIESTFALPFGGTADAVVELGEIARVEGWTLTVPESSYDAVDVAVGGAQTTVAPGESIDLRGLFPADLSLELAATPDPVDAGADLAVTATVANAGPETAADITLTMALPADAAFIGAAGDGWTCGSTPGTVSCTLDALNPGSASTLTATIAAPTVGGPAELTATVDAASGDPDTADNTAAASVVVNPSADLGLVADGPATAVPGTDAGFTLTVANQGPTVTDDVRLVAPFPAAADCSWTVLADGGATGATAGAGALDQMLSLPRDGSVVYNVTCGVAADAVGQLVFAASLTTSVPDPTPADQTTELVVTLEPSSDLVVDGESDPATALAGEQVDITLSLVSDGPSQAASSTLMLTVPAGLEDAVTTGCLEDPVGLPLCTTGDLAPGETATVVIAATVGPDPEPVLTVEASASSATADPNPANDTVAVDIVTDIDRPTVTAATTEDGEPVTSCETVLGPRPERLVIRFSERVQVGDARGIEGEALGADDPSAYRVVTPGPDLGFETTSCAFLAGDDEEVEVTAVTVAGDPSEATLDLAEAVDDQVRILICGADGIVDLAGNPLDGDGNGVGGDDWISTFRVDSGNRLSNAAFDCDLWSWMIGPVGDEALWSDIDVAGSTDSGSVEVELGLGIDPAVVSQCIPGPIAGTTMSATGALRADGGVAPVTAVLACAPAVTGCTTVGRMTTAGSLSATPGDGWVVGAFGEVAVNTVDALYCEVAVSGQTGQRANLDALRLEQSLLFADGFESGDTWQWSVTASAP